MTMTTDERSGQGESNNSETHVHALKSRTEPVPSDVYVTGA